jgi:phage baseplate assembly protein W
MDTAIEDGDFIRGSNGRPKQISGTQEIFQRTAIRLKVPLGNFVYDPRLGSRLHELKKTDSDLNRTALTMSQEALRAVPQVTVLSAEHKDNPFRAVINLSCNGQKDSVEVII